MSNPKKQLWPKVAPLEKSDDFSEKKRPVMISFNVSDTRKDSATTRSMKPVRKKIICEDFPRARSQVRTTGGRIVEMDDRVRAQLSREIQQGIEMEIEKQIANLSRKLEELKSGGKNERSSNVSQRNRCVLAQDRVKVKNGQKRREKVRSKKGNVGDLVNKMYVSDNGCCSRNTYAAIVFAAKIFKRKNA